MRGVQSVQKHEVFNKGENWKPRKREGEAQRPTGVARCRLHETLTALPAGVEYEVGAGYLVKNSPAAGCRKAVSELAVPQDSVVEEGVVKDWMPNLASSSSMARTADSIGDTLAACRHDSTLRMDAF
jgi:hypothetical protein